MSSAELNEGEAPSIEWRLCRRDTLCSLSLIYCFKSALPSNSSSLSRLASDVLILTWRLSISVETFFLRRFWVPLERYDLVGKGLAKSFIDFFLLESLSLWFLLKDFFTPDLGVLLFFRDTSRGVFGDLPLDDLGDLDRALRSFGDLDRALELFGDLDRAFGDFGDLDLALKVFGDLDRAFGAFGDLDRALEVFGDLDRVFGAFADLG